MHMTCGPQVLRDLAGLVAQQPSFCALLQIVTTTGHIVAVTLLVSAVLYSSTTSLPPTNALQVPRLSAGVAV